MNKSNESLARFLKNYASKPGSPDYAVLLNGAWGCGKTTFVRTCFQSSFDKKEGLYISLYGLSELSEISRIIFQSLHPILGSKTANFLSKSLGGFFRVNINLEDFLDTINKVDMDFNLRTTPSDDQEKNVKNTYKFLIFDDVERTQINLGSLFGFVNQLIQESNLRVILVADETQIPPQNEGENDSSYINHKHKVVGRTLTLEPNYELVLAMFTAENEKRDQNFCNLINSLQSEINEINHLSKNKNLRYIRSVIWEFECLFNQLSSPIKENSDFLRRLFLTYYIVRMEFYLSKRVDSEFNQFLKHFSGIYSPLAIQTGKYASINLGRVPCTPSILEDLFKGNSPNAELEALLAEESRLKERPDWEELWDYLNLEENRFNVLCSQVETKFAEGGYSSISEILHIAGLFILFEEKKLRHFDRTVEKMAMDAIDVLFEQNPDSFKNFIFSDNYSSGYGFHSSETDSFKNIKKYAAEKKMIMGIQHNQSILSDGQKACQFFIKSNQTYDSIYETNLVFDGRLLSLLSVKDFIAALKDLKFNDARIVIRQINSLRRLHSNYFEDDERQWIVDLKKYLLEESENPSNIQLKRIQMDCLSKQIEIRESPESDDGGSEQSNSPLESQ